MTNLDSHAPGQTSSAKRDTSYHTVYRDTPLANHLLKAGGRRWPAGSHLAVPEDEHLSGGILAGLAALTLPVVVYSFAQLWSLLAGGALTQAIRAFLP